ncbi:hypothetical protein [Myxacorys almedinensis]|uniref:Uncharacterized protein n=1 Tax=Myxacorys almedinensis A TaxID=2690445 RepID=A0A8J7YYC6_9CYAN|nr:hypothetical protein [Myxacorys almedinensis]NDJ16887.1 hypothetical protein [Myxacorys almedinensis A]
MSQDSNNARTPATDSSDRVQDDSYDRGIIPAETAARKEREGNQFKTTPSEAREAGASTDDQTDSESIRTTDGYTVDKEGLTNNYAIEPEMYYEEPGDAKQAEEEAAAERAEEYREINQDEEGKLTMEGDQRGRGTGAV